jgi:hypothetical protein
MSAIPAFLIPALTGFALSKLTGQSTKSSLRNALIGGIAGGITSGFGASQTATGIKEMGDAKVAEAVANAGKGNSSRYYGYHQIRIWKRSVYIGWKKF